MFLHGVCSSDNSTVLINPVYRFASHSCALYLLNNIVHFVKDCLCAFQCIGRYVQMDLLDKCRKRLNMASMRSVVFPDFAVCSYGSRSLALNLFVMTNYVCDLKQILNDCSFL